MIDPAVELAERLSSAIKPEDYHSALRNAMAALDAVGQETCQSNSITLACRFGCSLCCYLRVLATPPEVFLIAHHVKTRFSQTEFENLKIRLTAHLETIALLTPQQHMRKNIVCPLLKDGHCSVYQIRPGGCRYHHSTDFQSCQYSYDHPEDLEFPGARHPELLRSVGSARKILETVYTQQNFDMSQYELGSALAEALDNPSSWNRWRDGKKAFLKAAH